MKYRIGYLILLCILSIACTRQEADVSKITFTLPLSSSALNKADVGALSEDKSWGQTDPTSLSEINCYAIFIGGPDPDLSNKSCSIGSGASFKTISFGQGGGFYPAGSTITMESKAGPDRQFYVIGTKSGSAGCGNFDLSNPDAINSENYSNPLLIGQGTKGLVTGENNLSINVSLTNLTSQKIGDCNFFPNRPPLSSVRIAGPIAYGSGGSQKFQLGGGICNKFYLELSDANGGGGGFNDKNRVLSLTTAGTSASAVNVYSDENCSNPVTYPYQISINAGEREKEFFIKSTGPINNDGDAILHISSVSGFDTAFTISPIIRAISTAASTGQKPFFYDQSINIPAGQCEDIDFAMLDASGFTAKIPAATLGFRDLAGTSRTPAANYNAACGSATTISTTTADVSKSFGKLGLNVGANGQKDVFAIIDNSSNIAKLALNISPTASKFQITAPTSNIFVGDCLNIAATPTNILGTAVNFIGNDESGFSVGRRLLGNINFYSTTATGNIYDYASNSTCSSGSSVMGPMPLTLIAGTPSYSNYFRILTEDSYEFNIDAHPFVNGESSKISLNPLWSPYLLGGSLKSWLRIEDAAATALNMTSWNAQSYPTPVTALTNATLGTIKPLVIPHLNLNNRNAITFSNIDQQKFEISQSATQTLSVSFMIYIDSSGTAGKIMSMSGSAAEKMSMSVDSSAANVYIDLGGGAVAIAPGSRNEMVDKWSVITINMSQASTNLYSIYLNGSTQLYSSYDTFLTYNIDKIEFGDIVASGATAFKGKLTDVIVTNNTPSGADVLKIYNYFKNRFPQAGLP